MTVLMEELAAAQIQPLLPLPSDARALRAADWILTHPAEGTTAAALSGECGLSARTLERLFHAETGVRFGPWRQKARLLESMIARRIGTLVRPRDSRVCRSHAQK
jgi:transcriptional regulator GlxA family with amidase domain